MTVQQKCLLINQLQLIVFAVDQENSQFPKKALENKVIHHTYKKSLNSPFFLLSFFLV
jgi:hypothetical protein